MKFAGLLVMPAGFFLAIAALVLFPASGSPARAAFVLCGFAVSLLGLAVSARGHLEAQSKPAHGATAQGLDARRTTGA